MAMRAELVDNVLRLSTGRFERRFDWNGGLLVAQSMSDLPSGLTWTCRGQGVDLPGHDAAALRGEGELALCEIAATPLRPAHLLAQVTVQLGQVQLRRSFELFEDCPAMRCRFELRGSATGPWRSLTAASDAMQRNIEDAKLLAQREQPVAPLLERFTTGRHHLQATAVEFFDVTDRRNNLVRERSFVPYRHPLYLRGNLLLLRDAVAGGGLFLLKEGPCSDVQLADAGFDFVCDGDQVAVAGLGLDPHDLDEEAWMEGYSVAIGFTPGGPLQLLKALRAWQRTLRTWQAGRDHMIMLNTWGDRGQDRKVGHDFALAELEAAARLGVTHFQLDDGWQVGRSANSALPGGSFANIWDRDDYWQVDRSRFPRGLGPIVQAAQQRGIELCLWFNPCKDESYTHWQRDAEAMIRLHREHGIRTFKIDGVDIPDKRAERRLRAMFDRVMLACEGQAVFNLDVTAGRRFGYHHFTEYGNIFLENRYTDWGNYYPHWTLRNLWQLSRYVPASRLQVEFLNRWRNAERYPPDDPLAPSRVPFDYCFALTMMAQPLAWFEASGLPDEAFAIAPLVRTYLDHQQPMHEGLILPIGEEPSGASWTGFQSLRDDGGYVLLLREYTNRERIELPLHDLAGRRVRWHHLAGEEASLQLTDVGTVRAHLPSPLSFAWYRYALA